MKRALLINPWIYDFKAYDFFLKPLGLLYLASYLREKGFQIDFIDCLDRNHPLILKNFQLKKDKYGRGKFPYTFIEKPAVYKNIKRRYKRYGMPLEIFYEILESIKEPDYIFITSVMTYWYLGTFEMIKILKERFKAPIILGGIYPTLYYEHAKKYSSADIIIKGRFEKELYKYFDTLTKEEFFSLPYPAYDLYNKLDYVCLLTSIGCLYNCPYCAVKYLIKNYQIRKAEDVLKEIKHYKKMGIKNIVFYDDALLLNPEFKKLLKLIVEEKLELNFHTPNGLHPRYLDEETCYLMKKANFKTIYLSLETIDFDLQIKLGNKVKTEEFLRAYNNLINAGFSSEEIEIYLIIGLPNQPIESIKKSIEFLLPLKVKIHLAEYSPIPYTKIAENLSFIKEPLLTNNTIFPCLNEKEREKIEELKSWFHRISKM
ncbi:MAG: radical SAM protein [candidate division WOR-3 bacterium]|nr:radical SAM protein [candidate division WOR-3 bacterium]MCX7836808.1 radical SAM protein [candidate division WOR-3 bacterium]MDW8113875.1 B12-binding domain-containing radical SAM protein [candidate division WOR-3 bacterium]